MLFAKLSDENKDTILDMIIAAVSLIPVCGDMIENGTIIAVGIHKLIKDKEKADLIISNIRSKVRAYGLEESDAESIWFALTSVLHNKNNKLNEVFRNKDSIQHLKDEIFSASDHRRDAKSDYKKYISDAVNFIGSPEILPLLTNCDQIAVENLHEIREILNKLKLLTERTNQLEVQLIKYGHRLDKLECSHSGDWGTDNDDYLRYFDEKLFLEDDDSSITLKTMYVSQHVREGTCLASECIMSWYHDQDRNARSCMILYGDAGIGKTSLVSKIIADAYGKTEQDKHEYDLLQDEVLAIALRNYKEVFENLENDYSSISVICELFSVKHRNELKHKLLILDGFDELIVLIPSFTEQKAVDFIRGLAVEHHGLRILITSRDGYFDLGAEMCRYTVQKTLCWTENEVNTWCDRYSGQKEEKRAWCSRFKRQYRTLPFNQENDKRHEIFCIPIILYIACNSGVDLEKEKTVGQIYDHAFRSIIMREHSATMTGSDRLRRSEADKKMRLEHWQYTKELAYQMLFVRDLNLIDDDSSKDPRAVGFRNAQTRTEKQLKDKYKYNIDKSELSTSKYLAVFRFAKSNHQKGVTFAHKTVYEYFMAVKLYEDYIAKFNADYFADHEKSDEAKVKAYTEMMESFVEAFRYIAIPFEIFSYLIDMNRPAFTGDNSDLFPVEAIPENRKFNKQKFLDVFANSMQKELFARIAMQQAVKEYLKTNNFLNPVNVQFSLAFQNFTWYLSGLGYRNEIESRSAVERIIKSLSGSCMSIYCKKWCFEGADLADSMLEAAYLAGANLKNAALQRSMMEKAHLEEAHLEKANLKEADLSNAHLNKADLNCAILTGANLNRADLNHAKLIGTHMYGVKLIGADLNRADLSNADLEKADLSCAKLVNTNLSHVNLSRAHLRDANLRGADLSHADLSRSDLEKAYLNCANLIEADLYGADLRNACLSGSDLTGAILSHTDLNCARLIGTNLNRAYLIDADLSGADLDRAKLIEADLTGANLSGANLSGADLSGANLSDANLSGAKYCTVLIFPTYCKSPNWMTKFPEGFKPDAHGMIEVDLDGSPVKH